jgi:hypothetical protein
MNVQRGGIAMRITQAVPRDGESLDDMYARLEVEYEARDPQSQDVEQMVTKIVQKTADYGGVTFAELIETCGEAANGKMCICFSNRPNVILWAEVSAVFSDAMALAMSRKQIILKPTSSLTYAIDGTLLRFPLVKRPGSEDYKTPH